VLNDPAVIVERFRNQVDMIIDGGVSLSSPSTVLDLTGDSVEVERVGAGNLLML
jgi:tRNA A37 threonylcarbamoyladenosine synthetase subunit TsaC/SUA5/YrdC